MITSVCMFGFLARHRLGLVPHLPWCLLSSSQVLGVIHRMMEELYMVPLYHHTYSKVLSWQKIPGRCLVFIYSLLPKLNLLAILHWSEWLEKSRKLTLTLEAISLTHMELSEKNVWVIYGHVQYTCTLKFKTAHGLFNALYIKANKETFNMQYVMGLVQQGNNMVRIAYKANIS